MFDSKVSCFRFLSASHFISTKLNFFHRREKIKQDLGAEQRNLSALLDFQAKCSVTRCHIIFEENKATTYPGNFLYVFLCSKQLLNLVSLKVQLRHECYNEKKC